MTEPRETRLKRLKIRSWRRGTREMDLILGPFADAELRRFGEGELGAYEALLEVNDQDLYSWVCGAATATGAHANLVARIAAFHDVG